jgi:hypothetical protein
VHEEVSMSDSSTKDHSRTPRMLAVLAAAGLFMAVNVRTLEAEPSAVDASVEIGRNLSATLARNIKA